MILRAFFVPRRGVVRLAGFEPTTSASAGQRSNPLSYKRTVKRPAISVQEVRARLRGALIADNCRLLAFWCRGRDLNPHIRKDTAP